MIALRIDDETYAMWSERAAASGLSVEDWLKTETAQRPEFKSQEADVAPTISEKEWTARLRAFAERHRPTSLPLDDSRESIYD